MKISIDIDCTPDEARRFLGLPDVAPMQEALMRQVQERMEANVKALEPEALFQTWLPASIQGFEQLQKMFWSQMSQAGMGGGDADPGKGAGAGAGSSSGSSFGSSSGRGANKGGKD